MTIKVGINGFGRMGRLALREGWNSKSLEFSHINEVSCDADCSAHLLKYDSVHGKWLEAVSTLKKSILVNGERLSYSTEAKIDKVNWR